MPTTKAPQQEATKTSRRKGCCSNLRGSSVIALDRADENARPFHQGHCVEQHNQSRQCESDGDRTRAPRALLRFGKHNSVVVRILAHGDVHTHAANRAISPPHPRSTSSTANRRNRYRIEKAKRLRLARSAGRLSRKTCQPSTSMMAPVTMAVTPYSAPV